MKEELRSAAGGRSTLTAEVEERLELWASSREAASICYNGDFAAVISEEVLSGTG